jgi:hypothetical protein
MARRELTWTYQRIVLEDYLPTVAGAAVVNDVYRREGTTYMAGASTTLEVKLPDVRRLFYRWRYDPFMPVEFSGAVFRFGHSQIRPEYLLNQPLGAKPLFDPAGGDSLVGLRRRAPGWTIDWNLFFVVDGSTPQLSRRIDTSIVDPMLQLPDSIATDPSSVALRNLLRGCTYQLPSGQDTARAMGLQPLVPDELAATGAAGPMTLTTPLWYFVLAEAEVRETGQPPRTAWRPDSHRGDRGTRRRRQKFVSQRRPALATAAHRSYRAERDDGGPDQVREELMSPRKGAAMPQNKRGGAPKPTRRIVSPRSGGGYEVKAPKAQRASAVEPTKKAAGSRAKSARQ